MTTTFLVFADPRTTDDVVSAHAGALQASGADVEVVDLRSAAPKVAPHRPLPVRAVRAVSAPWLASRGLDTATRARLASAPLIVAGDRFAIASVWRMRRANRAGDLVNGIPAALAALRARAGED